MSRRSSHRPHSESRNSAYWTSARSSSRVFYGWRIVAVCFITHCLNVGTVFYAFGVFFRPLSAEFGWTRAATSWGFSLAAVLGAF